MCQWWLSIWHFINGSILFSNLRTLVAFFYFLIENVGLTILSSVFDFFILFAAPNNSYNFYEFAVFFLNLLHGFLLHEEIWHGLWLFHHWNGISCRAGRSHFSLNLLLLLLPFNLGCLIYRLENSLLIHYHVILFLH